MGFQKAIAFESLEKSTTVAAPQRVLCLPLTPPPSRVVTVIVLAPVNQKVVVNDVKEVDAIRQREMDITKERIEKILSSGATVVLTTKGIDDLCLKYFVEAGAMAVR